VAGSVIHDPAVVVQRAIDMVSTRRVTATNGTTITLDARTLCLHGDTPGAAELARQIRSALEAAGIAVKAFATSL
jgi:UPF0271 protein